MGVSATWLLIGWNGTATANIIGNEPRAMMEVIPLSDFGILDFSTGIPLEQVLEFQIESPDGMSETFYSVEWEITRTDLNETCEYLEDEITFSLWKSGGYGFIGEITNGGVISTANNPNAGGSIYELILTAISKHVCPSDYEVEISFYQIT